MSESKQRIIDAAMAQLYRLGYNRLSFGLVSLESGVPKSSIIHHFPNKDALVCAALKKHMGAEKDFIDSLVADEARDPRQRFAAYFDHAEAEMGKSNYVGCVASNVGLEVSETNPVLRKEIQAFIEYKISAFVRFIENGQESGVFRRDVDPCAEAQSILTSLEGGVVTSRISKSAQLLSIAVRVCRNIVKQLEPAVDNNRSSRQVV